MPAQRAILRLVATRGSKADEAGARERLLDAAIALFAERGYAGTGTQAICERAGLAKTALYWHFESKEGLLAAVLEAVGTGWIEHLRKLAYQEGNPEERLDALIRGWRELAETQPQLLRLPMIAQLEMAETSERVRDALEQIWQRAEDAIVQGIEDSLGRTLPELDLVARTAVMLLQGAVLRQISSPEPDAFERTLGELRRTLELLIWVRLPPEEQAAAYAMRRVEGTVPLDLSRSGKD